MKFLSIIIPRYKETERDLFPLLSSINNQLGVDFSSIEVIICTDGGGGKELDSDYLSLFENIEFRQVRLSENGGPGIARQAGIDNAKGQYLMFCDADDILHSVGVLGAMMQKAEQDAPDIIRTNWLEEMKNADGSCAYLTHSGENTWMFGKVIRRQYLIQTGIRHHPNLRVHEDSYFLALAAAFTNRDVYLDVTSYVWKFKPDSITRVNNGIYTYDSFPTFIYSCTEADRIIEKNAPAVMEQRIIQFVLYVYFTLHSANWAEHQDYVQKSEDEFWTRMKPFWHYWQNAAPDIITRMYTQERQRSFYGIETETLNAWIARMKGVPAQ